MGWTHSRPAMRTLGILGWDAELRDETWQLLLLPTLLGCSTEAATQQAVTTCPTVRNLLDSKQEQREKADEGHPCIPTSPVISANYTICWEPVELGRGSGMDSDTSLVGVGPTASAGMSTQSCFHQPDSSSWAWWKCCWIKLDINCFSFIQEDKSGTWYYQLQIGPDSWECNHTELQKGNTQIAEWVEVLYQYSARTNQSIHFEGQVWPNTWGRLGIQALIDLFRFRSPICLRVVTKAHTERNFGQTWRVEGLLPEVACENFVPVRNGVWKTMKLIDHQQQ